jgi:hypothetical protein
MPGLMRVGSVLLLAAVASPSATTAPSPATSESMFEGTFEYIPPLQGQCIIVDGRFVFLFGPVDGSGPMVANAGTYRIVGDTVTSTVTYSTDAEQVGTSFRWTVEAVAGDTMTWVVVDRAGKVTNRGRSVRVR